MYPSIEDRYVRMHNREIRDALVQISTGEQAMGFSKVRGTWISRLMESVGEWFIEQGELLARQQRVSMRRYKESPCNYAQ